MKPLFSEAGRTLLKTLAVGLLALAVQLTAQPDFHGAVLIGLAGLLALGATLLKAIVVYIPRLSWKSYLGDPWGAMADAFTHAGLATLVASLIGFLELHDLSTWHAVLSGAVVGALNAALTALEHAATPGLKPFPNVGLPKPAQAAPPTP